MPINQALLVNGRWFSPYMKVYSLEGNLRVMEISTYPRAFKDTERHVYASDVPFVVQESDLNECLDDGSRVYRDYQKSVNYAIGQIATRWAGTPLPGAFPLWVESEELETLGGVSNTVDEFLVVFDAVKGQLADVSMFEACYRKDTDAEWTQIPNPQNLLEQLTQVNQKLSFPKFKKDDHRWIVRILYSRSLRAR